MGNILRILERKMLRARRNRIPLPAQASYSTVTDLFSAIKHLPGWFTFDDCSHFCLALGFQHVLGIKGNILEIGSYHGRSSAVLARYLSDGEELILCDLFDDVDPRLYPKAPTPQKVLNNILSVNPNISSSSIHLIKGESSELAFDEDARFRFVHIDGGHSYEECMSDLLLCSNYIANLGIIVVDDFMNPDWPAVTQAVEDFLKKRRYMHIIADLNRTAALGRKLYLIKRD